MDDLPKHFHILLLTQEHCGFCEQARDILERLSREYWLSVSTLDMRSPEGQRLAVEGGLLFPPGVLIDGEPFSYGRLSERKLRRELDRRMGFVKRPPYVHMVSGGDLNLPSNLPAHEGECVSRSPMDERTRSRSLIPCREW